MDTQEWLGWVPLAQGHPKGCIQAVGWGYGLI